MMMKKEKITNISVVFDVNKKSRKTGTGIVYIKIYKDRTRKYISTGVSVYPHQWDDILWVVRHEDAVTLNRMIREQYEKVKNGIFEQPRKKLDEINTGTLKIDRSEASFLDWMQAQIERERISEGTRRAHRSVFRQLVEYGKIKRFDDVTRKSMKDFLEWVSTRKVKKMIDGKVVTVLIGQSRIYGYWKVMRKYIRIAQNDDLIQYGVIDGISIARGEDGDREHLTDEEIEIWRTTKMPSARHADARDRFLVQMGTGIAYADLMSVDFSKRQELNGYPTLSGKRTKTHEQYFLVILPIAQEILEKWDWKVPTISNQDYNRYLLEVASICGIKKHITSHVGRHTYACQCLAHGVRLEAVQRLLGHTSIKTTQIYAKLVDTDVANAFDKTDFWNKSEK